jgi:hypothetical protein
LVRHALAIDVAQHNTFWRKAIAKEMQNVMPAFEFWNNDKIPLGYKKVDCHIIFDIKIDLTRKFRLLVDGHQTDVPK